MKQLIAITLACLVAFFAFGQTAPPTPFELNRLKGNKKLLREALYYPSYNVLVFTGSTNFINANITETNHVIIVDATGTNTTVELPDAADAGHDHRIFWIATVSTSTATLATTNGEPVTSGASSATNSTYTLASNTTALVVYQDVGFYVLPQ